MKNWTGKKEGCDLENLIQNILNRNTFTSLGRVNYPLAIRFLRKLKWFGKHSKSINGPQTSNWWLVVGIEHWIKRLHTEPSLSLAQTIARMSLWRLWNFMQHCMQRNGWVWSFSSEQMNCTATIFGAYNIKYNW